MTCSPSQPPVDVDIPALQKKYLAERAKRLNPAGQSQYVRPTGGKVAAYSEDPHMPTAARDPLQEELEVLVVGAGFGGILASWHLMKAGVTDIRNLDSAGDFGGVWYWNRYPGIQCDNDAYCYLPMLEETGFMPSKKFSDGWEIQHYCRTLAERGGFADRALFHTMLDSMVWSEAAQRWEVTTDRGDVLKPRFVIMACGVLNMPKLPGIRGIDEFQGKIFHSSRWDYDYTGGSWQNPALEKLADKRVAIVGTGATAVQAVPYLGRYCQHLYVVQRTPSSIDERSNPQTDENWFKNQEPGWQQARIANFHRAAMEAFLPGEPDLICDIWTELNRNLSAWMAEDGWPEISMEEFMARREEMDYRIMERLRQRVDAMVDDAQTAEALKPYYRFLCKRPLSNDEFYPTFNRDNVDLIDVSETRGLQELTTNGFIANGQEYAVDCIIFASGFEVTSDLDRRWGISRIEGRDGVSLYDHWRDGPRTLHGTMTHQFPNQFFIGYIQGSANASVTEQFGAQGFHSAAIIAQALEKGLAVVEPTLEAQEAYVKQFQEIMMDTSAYQAYCPPSYFNNEGDESGKWALFNSWGYGWNAFQDMVTAWRESGELEGMRTEAKV
jgi:cation diffusion facilitator CzcD-associated flavoprotein CzcO